MPNHKHILFLFIGVLVVVGLYFYMPYKHLTQNVIADDSFKDGQVIKLPDVGPAVTHIKTPESVRALYMTSWVAGTSSIRDRVINLLDTTEANAVVIDIKDATGKIAFTLQDEPFASLESSNNRIPNIKDLIEKLHAKNIYVIGRIAVFQDPYLIKKWPEEAVKTDTDRTLAWQDRKGIGWFDAGSQKVWDYVVDLARESHDVGFDEINFDYVRFPSDGDMNDIYFPISDGKSKPDVIESFFQYLDMKLRATDDPIVISADLFGLTTTTSDGLGIGQVLEKALPYFDFVDPMVYPSHFPDTWNGFANPADHPYDIIKITMDSAVSKAKSINENPLKIRPWLQDFNMGAVYTAEMVRAQITATYDSGLNSWLIWDPKNIYTKGALLPI
jgi:hypothetical protein